MDSDTLVLEYALCPTEKRDAIASLVRAQEYAVATHEGENLVVSIKGSPVSCLVMLGTALEVGRKEFGKIWLDELKEKVSRLM